MQMPPHPTLPWWISTWLLGSVSASGSVGNSTNLKNSEIISGFLTYVSGAFSPDWVAWMFVFFFLPVWKGKDFFWWVYVYVQQLQGTSYQDSLNQPGNWTDASVFTFYLNLIKIEAKSYFLIWPFDCIWPIKMHLMHRKMMTLTKSIWDKP